MADLDLSSFSAKYNALNSMTQDLCNAFPINDLFPTMITCRVIDFTEKEEICAERTERGRVSAFLSMLSGELKIWEDTRFDRFMEMMKRSPKCTFLRKRLEARIDHFAQSSATSPPPITSAGSTQGMCCVVWGSVAKWLAGNRKVPGSISGVASLVLLLFP